MIGNRLRLMRDLLDITQAELAEMLETTQSAIASMESGIYKPSEQYLQKIARQTGFTVDFFNKGEMPEFPFGSILYRAQATVKQTPKTRAHALAHVSFEFADTLANRLRKIPVNVPR